MRFVVAGGGVAGLAAAIAVARAGHQAVVLERDAVEPSADPFADDRRGIPHFLQPHSFLPRGRRELAEWAPDVLAALLDAGAELQDIGARLKGEREPGDEELVYLWVRRPLIEWALRRAAAAEPAVALRSGTRIAAHADGGVVLEGGETVSGDIVVDALGRYRPPEGWPREERARSECGALYYSRYFRRRDGVEFPDGGAQNPLNPRGDLGYLGFNTFRGDNRTYAVIVLIPNHDRELRALRHEDAWMAACRSVPQLDVLTAPAFGEPITDVMAMGGLLNVDWTGEPSRRGPVAVGDALCHTDPAFAYGLSFSLAHAHALGRAAAATNDRDELVARYRDDVISEARERFALARATDDARMARWRGAQLDPTRRDGCYPLFSFTVALAASTQDDHVLRRTIRRIGLLDRTDVFDGDDELHTRIEAIAARAPSTPPALSRDELLSRLPVAV